MSSSGPRTPREMRPAEAAGDTAEEAPRGDDGGDAQGEASSDGAASPSSAPDGHGSGDSNPASASPLLRRVLPLMIEHRRGAVRASGLRLVAAGGPCAQAYEDLLLQRVQQDAEAVCRYEACRALQVATLRHPSGRANRALAHALSDANHSVRGVATRTLCRLARTRPSPAAEPDAVGAVLERLQPELQVRRHEMFDTNLRRAAFRVLTSRGAAEMTAREVAPLLQYLRGTLVQRKRHLYKCVRCLQDVSVFFLREDRGPRNPQLLRGCEETICSILNADDKRGVAPMVNVLGRYPAAGRDEGCAAALHRIVRDSSYLREVRDDALRVLALHAPLGVAEAVQLVMDVPQDVPMLTNDSALPTPLSGAVWDLREDVAGAIQRALALEEHVPEETLTLLADRLDPAAAGEEMALRARHVLMLLGSHVRQVADKVLTFVLDEAAGIRPSIRSAAVPILVNVPDFMKAALPQLVGLLEWPALQREVDWLWPLATAVLRALRDLGAEVVQEYEPLLCRLLSLVTSAPNLLADESLEVSLFATLGVLRDRITTQTLEVVMANAKLSYMEGRTRACSSAISVLGAAGHKMEMFLPDIWWFCGEEGLSPAEVIISEDESVPRAACQALLRVRQDAPSVVKTEHMLLLLDYLHYLPPKKLAAAHVLAEVLSKGDSCATDILDEAINRVAQGTPQRRHDAAHFLNYVSRHLTEEHWKKIDGLLESSDPTHRWCALTVLRGSSWGFKNIGAVVARLHDASVYVPITLQTHDDPAASRGTSLMGLLCCGREVAAAAYGCLESFLNERNKEKSDEVLGYILGVLRSPDPWVRSHLTRMIEAGPRDRSDSLRKFIQDRMHVLYAMTRCSPENPEHVRVAAIQLVGELLFRADVNAGRIWRFTKRTLPALLRDTSPYVRAGTIMTLIDWYSRVFPSSPSEQEEWAEGHIYAMLNLIRPLESDPSVYVSERAKTFTTRSEVFLHRLAHGTGWIELDWRRRQEATFLPAVHRIYNTDTYVG